MQISAIKIEQKKRGISDEDYRALLARETGKTSSTQLTDEERKRVYVAMTRPMQRPAATTSKTPAEAKIWALWYQLKPFLCEEERNFNYLMGFVRRVTGNNTVAKLCYLSSKEEYLTIEALKQRIDYEEKRMKDVPF